MAAGLMRKIAGDGRAPSAARRLILTLFSAQRNNCAKHVRTSSVSIASPLKRSRHSIAPPRTHRILHAERPVRAAYWELDGEGRWRERGRTDSALPRRVFVRRM